MNRDEHVEALARYLKRLVLLAQAVDQANGNKPTKMPSEGLLITTASAIYDGMMIVRKAWKDAGQSS